MTYAEIERLHPDVHRMDGYLYADGVAYRFDSGSYIPTELRSGPEFDRMLLEIGRGSYISHIGPEITIHTYAPRYGLILHSSWALLAPELTETHIYVRTR